MVENDIILEGSSKQNALFWKIFAAKKRIYDLLSRIGSGSISFTSNLKKFLFMNII